MVKDSAPKLNARGVRARLPQLRDVGRRAAERNGGTPPPRLAEALALSEAAAGWADALDAGTATEAEATEAMARFAIAIADLLGPWPDEAPTATFETDRLTGTVITEDATDWQHGTEPGRNPVDAAVEWLNGDEVVGPDIMWPLVLANLARISVAQARTMIADAVAECPEDWIGRLRAHCPPSTTGS